jgi:hypothetical protein
VGEDTLGELGEAVLARFREEALAEETARATATRLHMAAMRKLQRYLVSGRQPVPQRVPSVADAAADQADSS